MTESAITDAVDGYARFFETLTPETLDRLSEFAAPDIRFKDPFNDVTGIDPMRAIFLHMFEKMERPAFQVTHRAKDAQDDAVWFLRWRLTGQLRALSNRDWSVEGMSEIHFDSGGRVVAHIDYWDAGQNFYEMLPVIGRVIRLLRKRVGRT